MIYFQVLSYKEILFKNLVLINFKVMVYGYFYGKGLGLRMSVSVRVKG